MTFTVVDSPQLTTFSPLDLRLPLDERLGPPASGQVSLLQQGHDSEPDHANDADSEGGEDETIGDSSVSH